MHKKMNRTVAQKHSDYSLASCTIQAGQTEVPLQVLQMSMCDCVSPSVVQSQS